MAVRSFARSSEQGRDRALPASIRRWPHTHTRTSNAAKRRAYSLSCKISPFGNSSQLAVPTPLAHTQLAASSGGESFLLYSQLLIGKGRSLTRSLSLAPSLPPSLSRPYRGGKGERRTRQPEEGRREGRPRRPWRASWYATGRDRRQPGRHAREGGGQTERKERELLPNLAWLADREPKKDFQNLLLLSACSKHGQLLRISMA